MWNRRRAWAFVAVLSVAFSVSGALIPASRLADWTPGVMVGVPGGIRARTEVFTNLSGLDTTGGSDVSSIIQSAVNACPSNQVVLLPAGILRFEAPVNMKSFITVRGAGMTNTVIDFVSTWGAAFQMGTGWSWQWNNPAAPSNSIISGFMKGSSNLVFASVVSPDTFCMISELNDLALPVLHTMGYERMRRQLTRVVSVTNGNRVTIWPPLVWTMQTNLQPTFAMGSQDIRFAGVENLTVNATNSSSSNPIMAMEEAYACWWANIKVSRGLNRNFGITDSAQCEMRGCWSDKSQGGVTPNHAGLLFSQSASSLIEDNIFDDVFPNIEVWGGCAGNVFGYNLANSSYWGGSINGNHAPHPQYNLWEGNVSANFQSDGYYGSASEDTLFRNWFHTELPYGTSSGIWAIKLNRFNRNANIIANVLGTPHSNLTYYGQWNLGKPNIGNEDWSGFGPPWSVQTREGGTIKFSQNTTNITASSAFFGSTNAGWYFQDRSSALMLGTIAFTSSTRASVTTAGSVTNHSFAIAPGPPGWQELDTGVQSTALIMGNYNFPIDVPVVAAMAWPTNDPNTSLGTNLLPASLYLTRSPSWWGTNHWPAIGSDLAPLASMIPAQERFLGIPVGFVQRPSPPGIPRIIGSSSGP